MENNQLKESALELLHAACVPFGILASPDDQDNYKRLWSRDAMISGLAGLLAEDEEILDAFEDSIRTLANYQHSYGMIPSNVLPDADNPDISYGGLAGRVDATSWFIVGSCLYLSYSGNNNLKEELQTNLLQALELLDRWEFNGEGLLYTPLSGNWADEYPLQGHTLYDNCLRLWALNLYAELYDDQDRSRQADSIREKVSLNFWPEKSRDEHPEVYHSRIFSQLAGKNPAHYAAAVDPGGYNMNFDAAGHGLALLLQLPDQQQLDSIRNHAEAIFEELHHDLLPAFWPVIRPGDPDWQAIEKNYSYEFKNYPHKFHNGGIWPVWMGLFGLGMSKAGSPEIAERMLDAWMQVENKNEPSFSEYIGSDTFKPGGKQRLSYSASGLIFLQEAINPNIPLSHLVH